MSIAVSPALFAKLLCHWQQLQGRHHLPWQQQPTPYRVLVAEVMLQQTQVNTVIDYYQRWMARFPTLTDLYHATEDNIMRHWQGLGYYQRARRLQQAARYIVDECAGEFPSTLTTLLAVPGIGPYTAGAVMSFAYNQYGPIVDGNVKRFYSRYFGLDAPLNSKQSNDALWAHAERFTPENNNRQFTQALLDIGAGICTRHQPKCDQCPVQTTCFAYGRQQTELLPVVAPKKKKTTLVLHFAWCESNQRLLLEKRAPDGIWGALWCLPEIAAPPKSASEPLFTFTHALTHRQIQAYVWRKPPLSAPHLSEFAALEINQLGLPAPIKQSIKAYLPSLR